MRAPRTLQLISEKINAFDFAALHAMRRPNGRLVLLTLNSRRPLESGRVRPFETGTRSKLFRPSILARKLKIQPCHSANHVFLCNCICHATGQCFMVLQHSDASLQTPWMKSFCALRRLCSSSAMRSSTVLFGHSALRIGFASVTSGSTSAGRQTIERLLSA